MMILQNHTKLEMDVQDPCGEMHPASCDASQEINIKVERVSDAEKEEGPMPITFPKIKMEPEVRCMSLYVHCKAALKKIKNALSLSGLHLNVCEHETTLCC
jgi:hypothetical protein